MILKFLWNIHRKSSQTNQEKGVMFIQSDIKATVVVAIIFMEQKHLFSATVFWISVAKLLGYQPGKL